ncbi:MAG: hydroxylamine reductase, partial [Planctomycetota bacterium]
MFCYQCEQSAGGKGCTKIGVCGKTPETAELQDLLVYASQGISMYAYRAGQLGLSDRTIDHFVTEALFTTVTNVNFDPVRLEALVAKAGQILGQAKSLYSKACQE